MAKDTKKKKVVQQKSLSQAQFYQEWLNKLIEEFEWEDDMAVSDLKEVMDALLFVVQEHAGDIQGVTIPGIGKGRFHLKKGREAGMKFMPMLGKELMLEAKDPEMVIKFNINKSFKDLLAEVAPVPPKSAYPKKSKKKSKKEPKASSKSAKKEGGKKTTKTTKKK